MVGSMDDRAAEGSGSRSKDASKMANKYLISEDLASGPRQVPFTGEGRHWYDIPYKLLNWILLSAKRLVAWFNTAVSPRSRNSPLWPGYILRKHGQILPQPRW